MAYHTHSPLTPTVRVFLFRPYLSPPCHRAKQTISILGAPYLIYTLLAVVARLYALFCVILPSSIQRIRRTNQPLVPVEGSRSFRTSRKWGKSCSSYVLHIYYAPRAGWTKPKKMCNKNKVDAILERIYGVVNYKTLIWV